MKMSDIKKQPIAYVLVGLPGSGKSTWVRGINRDGDFVIVSSDDEIEKYAKDKGLTYSDVFSDYVKTATSLMQSKFKEAIAGNHNIIWDQTNMTSKKRKGILQQIPKNYKKIAVVFQIDEAELTARLEKRNREEGKHIPQSIIYSMAKSFEMPTTAEGFNEVIRA